MANQVFVSPGVYTSELDLTYVVRQVGVTTLGLVGETTMGPAFQPIFVDNYTNFMTFFGGTNATVINDPATLSYPQYELPYIAKSYLSQSNQLFVTRVLGFSGYKAGAAWGVLLDAAMDPATSGTTTGGASYNHLLTYTATNAGTNVTIVSSDSLLTTLLADPIVGPEINNALVSLGSSATGTTFNVGPYFIKSGSLFEGISFNLYVNNRGTNGSYITGTTTGVTVYYTGSSYTEVENQLVALIRSRGVIDSVTQNANFEVTGTTGVGGLKLDPTYSAATANPLGVFSLSGNSVTKGNFDYPVTLDVTQRNYLTTVLGTQAQPGSSAVWVEEFYPALFATLNAEGKIRGIKQSLAYYGFAFDNYQQQYSEAVTPYIVSEIHSNKVSRLFRFHTISDGNAANSQIKISIANIDPDSQVFDVQIRSFYDTDARPVFLEVWSKCTMDPTSNNFIARKIGTSDGNYPSNSSYVLVELDTTTDTSNYFPAGFVGYPIRNYQANSNSTVVSPELPYKAYYGTFDNKRKIYLGLSDTVGIDENHFDYKGAPQGTNPNIWTGLTSGYHLDINASAVTIDGVVEIINATGGTYSPVFNFVTGDWSFQTDAGITAPNSPYAQVYSRKFTFAPYGGFDGWNVYNLRRSNTDQFLINQTKGINGLASTAFANRALSNGDNGSTSDYYAYLEGIWTFQNPDSVNINVFATPGIDTFNNQNLVSAAIEMIENDRADSLYIVTTPDNDGNGNILSVQDVTNELYGNFDSNYTATYWPWVQINDAENNVYVWVPPTRDVVRNIALTDNIAFPWFATAGIQRGDMDVIQARMKPTLSDRDTLYENRINPIATFSSDGVKIWGNRTLQVADTYLNRVNVRRLLLQARKLISAVSIRLLFEPNDTTVRNKFLSLVNPILDNIRSERGLSDFRVVLSNDPADIDNNQLTGQIFLKPTTALEFIQLQFVIMDSGASFNNI